MDKKSKKERKKEKKEEKQLQTKIKYEKAAIGRDSVRQKMPEETSRRMREE